MNYGVMTTLGFYGCTLCPIPLYFLLTNISYQTALPDLRALSIEIITLVRMSHIVDVESSRSFSVGTWQLEMLSAYQLDAAQFRPDST